MRKTFLLLISSVVLWGCPEEDSGPSFTPMTYVSYNAGLAHGAVALSSERIPLVLDALKTDPVDVLCLQEVWRDADYDRFVTELESLYPHNFREVTRDDTPKTVKCSDAPATNDLNTCVDTNCTPQGISTEECVTTVCKDPYEALTVDCRLCLAANTADPFACVLTGAQEFTFGGRNGLILFSKHPIDNPSFTAYDTLLVKRGVISATVQGVNIQCTHMSADLAPVVPYPEGRDFTTWGEEHMAQINVLDGLAPADTCTVLLGDLNTGPGNSTITAELETNFTAIEGLGYVDPWPEGTCTWCADNPLTGATGNNDEFKLDHVMARNCEGATFTSTRVMDQPTDVESGGNTISTRLSDHYGVKLEMK